MVSTITLPVYSAAIPKKPFAHVTLPFNEGDKISDVAKDHMREVWGGNPYIESVTHDDGTITRFCFTQGVDYFLSWNIR